MEKEPDNIKILYSENDKTYTVETYDIDHNQLSKCIFRDPLGALISAQKIQNAYMDIPINLFGFPYKHPNQTTLDV